MADIVGLIPEIEKTSLKSASEVRAVSDGASLASDKAAVAKLINCAANTGAYNVLVNHPLSDELIETLTTEGYTVTKDGLARESDQYLIDWKE